MERLLGAGYRVINYDARGHGDSEWPSDADYSLDALRDDLAAVTRTLDGPPILIGASMGGSTALLYLGEAPGAEAAALVLVDIVPQAETEGVERVRAFMAADPEGFATLDEAADAIARYNPNRSTPPSSAGLKKNLRRRPDGRYIWHWDPRFLRGPRVISSESLLERTTQASAAVKVPVLLINGRHSDIVRPEGVDAFRALIPHLEVAEVRGAGHMVAGDDNDVFMESVLGFLSRAA